MLTKPVSIYINWSAYDELSDNVELTEDLAQRQLDEVLRLRSLGVRFDYYLNDAFWYARDGGYRQFRKPHWQQGPERFFQKCLEHDIKPGLWISGNSLAKLDPVPARRDSLNASGTAMCCFYGGFFPHLLESMAQYVKQGVRLFKLDFWNLGAATPALERSLLPSEIRAQNIAAIKSGFKAFRQEYPDVLLIAYNGLEEADTQSRTDIRPFRKTVDVSWLEAYDSLYCGDPRPADVPAMNFWRAKDVYSDHMVRVYEQNGFPLNRIDNSGFMIGTTGTCYLRGKAAWKGMLLLSLARGGWINTYYGNMELLTEADGRWFAKAQALLMTLQQYGHCSTFGSMPGDGKPYGMLMEDGNGAVSTVVNPSQSQAALELPEVSTGWGSARILFRDAGFVPMLSGNRITLGAEQMALIGCGKYADAVYDLGIQEDVVIPASNTPLSAEFRPEGEKAIAASVMVPASASLRVIFRQFNKTGAKRSSGGAPPDGIPLGQILRITAEQTGQHLDAHINYDKAIWSGLSWAVGEVSARQLEPGVPVNVRCSTTEEERVKLSGELYSIQYQH